MIEQPVRSLSNEITAGGKHERRFSEDGVVTALAVEVDKNISSTEDCVQKADQYLRELPPLNSIIANVKVGDVLKSMLEHAPSEGGKKYAALAITTNGKRGIDGNVNAEGLAMLANDWISYILLPWADTEACHALKVSLVLGERDMGVENRYSVKWFTSKPSQFFSVFGREFVEFTDKSGKDIDLPDPRLLALHAAITHVLNETGIGEFLDLLMDRFDSSLVVPAEDFGGRDLALRAMVMELAGSSRQLTKLVTCDCWQYARVTCPEPFQDFVLNILLSPFVTIEHHQRTQNLSDEINTERKYERQFLEEGAGTVLREELKKNTSWTEDCVHEAVQYLRDLPPLSTIAANVQVSDVLKSMMEHAPCELGKKYAALAITTYGKRGVDGHVNAEGLTILANEWISYILLPFKSTYKHDQSDFWGPDIASTKFTPSNSKTEIPSGPRTAADKYKTFRKLLARRQRRQCAVFKPCGRFFIEATHILKPSLVVNKKHGADMVTQDKTWDMLCHYGDISVKNIQEKRGGTLNGFLLEPGMHKTFAEFEWCFVATGVKNQYEVRWFTEPLAFFVHCGRKVVEFEDHSGEGIASPEPRFLALHAAIAHVLNETGIGKFLDLLMERFNPAESLVSPSKFGGRDLALRAMVMELAGNCHQLPESTKVTDDSTDQTTSTPRKCYIPSLTPQTP
ncbi:hypothetical protein BD410DRAFT_899184 [Rickenella mellea]|uniref:HNH nuclease domain-containing protein n=1 Tax=Rickenella mellea TaxID=50990 RepID=A0A4Y7PZS4_9AGAM|nr:hypothetical protein BD410DRAFT_899184 [Rickenella mellea]